MDTMKKIPLTPTGFALVDDEDYDHLSKWSWHREMLGKKHKAPYARRGTNYYGGVKKSKAMHRYLLDAPNGLEVDHINGNTLDNRKANLRLCTRSENAKNKAVYRNNKSGCKGVNLHSSGKWRARIQVDGKRISLGLYDSLDEAKIAYSTAAKKYYGRFERNGHICWGRTIW